MHSGTETPTIEPRPLALGGLMAMASSVGIGRFIYTPILPFMAEGLQLTKADAGLIASANFMGYLVGALVAATWLPGSKRSWMIASLAASAVTTGAMGLSRSVPFFLALRFLGGAASAFVLVLASTLVLERLNRAGKDNLSAVHFAGVGVGIAASALLIWGLAELGNGWQSMWFGGCLATVVSTMAVALLVPAVNEHRPAVAAPAIVRSGTRFWPLVMAYGLFGFGYVITATFIVSMVRASPNARSIEPFVWLVVGLFAIPSVAVWSAAARRAGALKALSAACLLEAIGVAMSVVSDSIGGLFVSAVLLGCTFMGITALGMIAARTMFVGSPQRSLALMTAAFGLGQVIGPVAAGYGFELTGSFYLPTLAAAAALCISAVLTAFFVRR
jgi:predicted MFS family arabinose efflux permease